VQLPKLPIQIFGGDLQPFWGSFKAAIYSSSQLNRAQKFSYLCTQVHGYAAQANFPVLTTLEKNFGKSHTL